MPIQNRWSRRWSCRGSPTEQKYRIKRWSQTASPDHFPKPGRGASPINRRCRGGFLDHLPPTPYHLPPTTYPLPPTTSHTPAGRGGPIAHPLTVLALGSHTGVPSAVGSGGRVSPWLILLEGREGPTVQWPHPRFLARASRFFEWVIGSDGACQRRAAQGPDTAAACQLHAVHRVRPCVSRRLHCRATTDHSH